MLLSNCSRCSLSRSSRAFHLRANSSSKVPGWANRGGASRSLWHTKYSEWLQATRKCGSTSWVVAYVSLYLKFNSLTLWERGYNIFVLWNRPETSSCRLLYQCHSSSANCIRELFKGSNGSASHLDCTWKIFGWGLQIFCLGFVDFSALHFLVGGWKKIFWLGSQIFFGWSCEFFWLKVADQKIFWLGVADFSALEKNFLFGGCSCGFFLWGCLFTYLTTEILVMYKAISQRCHFFKKKGSSL